jgi:hypothetical protein
MMAISRKTNEASTGANLERLPKLAERWDARKSKADDARSDLGTLAKEVEDLGFNRAAFKLTMKLRNMEPEKRNDFLSSLNAYADKLGVFAQGDMFGDAPTGVGPDNGAAEPNEEARRIGRENGLAGHRDNAARYPAGDYGHADYELGHTEGQDERARVMALGDGVAPEQAGPPRGRGRLSPDTETQASA